MQKEEPQTEHLESQLKAGQRGDGLLLQIRSDRRLGHEWDDWDGNPLPNGGEFRTGPGFFFALLAGLILAFELVAGGVLWLMAPRLSAIWTPLPGLLWGMLAAVGVSGFAWLGLIAVVLRTGRNWLPRSLAEGGLVPWLLPHLERFGVALGMSRDRVGNASLRVFNALTVARRRPGVRPDEVLILLPRCLGKEAMQNAMGVSERYGVPMFVAARGRYARQMISMRRPRAIVALACERDLVSGVHDVAGSLPVLGTTLRLADGPCRNTEYDVTELESQICAMLGLDSPRQNPADVPATRSEVMA